MKSYMDTLPESLTKEQKELVHELFNWLIQPCLGIFKIWNTFCSLIIV